ncbi:uncharacterized protein [Prorops nasuta]|uniref:uncharacterized protein n=1 Tax=Prorops nasuta TaxID=863751 RepID=UPI0034D0088C
MWLFNGYKYFIKKKTDNVIYLSCIKHKLFNCKARGKYSNGKFYLIKSHTHHEIKTTEIKNKVKFYNTIKDLCKIPGIEPIKIYEAAKLRYPEAAKYITYCSCRRTIQRFIGNMNRLSPNNEKIKNLLDLLRYLKNNKNANLFEYIHGEEKSKLTFQAIYSESSFETDLSIVLYDEKLIEKINLKGSSLYIDATYRVVLEFKNRKVQFLTVLTKVENKTVYKAIPLIWAFMNNRSEESYTKIFQFLKDTIPSFYPAHVMTDYEKAIGNGLKKIYQNIILLLPLFASFLKVILQDNYYIIESINNNTCKLREQKKVTREKNKEINKFYKRLKLIETEESEDLFNRIVYLFNNFTEIRNLKNQEIQNMENLLRNIKKANFSENKLKGDNIPEILINNNTSPKEIRDRLMLLRNRNLHNKQEFKFIVINYDTGI